MKLSLSLYLNALAKRLRAAGSALLHFFSAALRLIQPMKLKNPARPFAERQLCLGQEKQSLP